MKRRIVQLLDSNDDFIVACHTQPDGDGLGSLLALGLFLNELGKKTHLGWGEEIVIPIQYKFLPGVKLLQNYCDGLCAPVFVALDCANEKRLGSLNSALGRAEVILNVDHHPDNSHFGTVNYVDPQASSVAEILYEILKIFDVPISPEVALCLYVGLVTDTGRFQYSNTTSKALRVAAELIELGVDPNYVFQNLFEKNPLSQLKMIGKSLNQACFLPREGVAYTVISSQDFSKAGASIYDTENIIDWLRSLDGASVAIVFKELGKGEVKVSLRSKGEDVSSVANHFGGGGHRNAAGFVAKGSCEEILKNILSLLNKRKEASE